VATVTQQPTRRGMGKGYGAGWESDPSAPQKTWLFAAARHTLAAGVCLQTIKFVWESSLRLDDAVPITLTREPAKLTVSRTKCAETESEAKEGKASLDIDRIPSCLISAFHAVKMRPFAYFRPYDKCSVKFPSRH
jgi:hypothetical protein